MTCAHREEPVQVARFRAICPECRERVITCAFCGFRDRSVAATQSPWRQFGISRRVEPKMFPIDPRDPARPDREIVEWNCCPECFAESGEAALTRYLNARPSDVLQPRPSYQRVYNYRGELLGELEFH